MTHAAAHPIQKERQPRLKGDSCRLCCTDGFPAVRTSTKCNDEAPLVRRSLGQSDSSANPAAAAASAEQPPPLPSQRVPRAPEAGLQGACQPGRQRRSGRAAAAADKFCSAGRRAGHSLAARTLPYLLLALQTGLRRAYQLSPPPPDRFCSAGTGTAWSSERNAALPAGLQRMCQLGRRRRQRRGRSAAAATVQLRHQRERLAPLLWCGGGPALFNGAASRHARKCGQLVHAELDDRGGRGPRAQRPHQHPVVVDVELQAVKQGGAGLLSACSASARSLVGSG